MRRVGSTPQQRGCTTEINCPDVMELDNGDYLVIGKIVPEGSLLIAEGTLEPMGASIGADEMAIVVPRRCIIDAAREILRGEDIN